jgi:hypothetical protein
MPGANQLFEPHSPFMVLTPLLCGFDESDLAARKALIDVERQLLIELRQFSDTQHRLAALRARWKRGICGRRHDSVSVPSKRRPVVYRDDTTLNQSLTFSKCLRKSY